MGGRWRCTQNGKPDDSAIRNGICVGKKALTDLINRTMISSFVYPIFWISIGLSNEIYKTHRELLFLNFAFASLLTIIRTSFVFSLKQIIDRHYKTITLLFVITVIVQGFHFSCLTIYIYFTEDLQSLIIPMVVSSGGILAAGATTLGINRIIRFLFPITFIFPMVAALMWHFNPVNFRISIILIISYSYHFLQGRLRESNTNTKRRMASLQSEFEGAKARLEILMHRKPRVTPDYQAYQIMRRISRTNMQRKSSHQSDS